VSVRLAQDCSQLRMATQVLMFNDRKLEICQRRSFIPCLPYKEPMFLSAGDREDANGYLSCFTLKARKRWLNARNMPIPNSG
jgi:hypothetical protein